MANVFTVLIGLALGVWQTRRLQQATVQILGQASPSTWALGTSLVRRLLPLVLLLGLLLAWAPVAALAALGGYWLGRTVVLTHDLFHLSVGRE